MLKYVPAPTQYFIQCLPESFCRDKAVVIEDNLVLVAQRLGTWAIPPLPIRVPRVMCSLRTGTTLLLPQY
jgi:hypothetical protein